MKTAMEMNAEYAAKMDEMKPGDGVTVTLYTDRVAYSVVEKGKRHMILREDKAIRKTEPIITPGGFAGHCINNDSIEYDYEPDPGGREVKITKRVGPDGYVTWKMVGTGTNSRGMYAYPGRDYKYDYNF